MIPPPLGKTTQTASSSSDNLMTANTENAPVRRGLHKVEKLYNIKSDHANAWLRAMQHQGYDLDAISPPMQSKALQKVHRIPSMMIARPSKISPLNHTPLTARISPPRPDGSTFPITASARKKDHRLAPLPSNSSTAPEALKIRQNSVESVKNEESKNPRTRSGSLQQPKMANGSNAKKSAPPIPSIPNANNKRKYFRTDPLGAPIPRPRGPLTPLTTPQIAEAGQQPSPEQSTPLASHLPTPASEIKPVVKSVYGGLSDKWRSERLVREEEMRGFLMKMGIEPSPLRTLPSENVKANNSAPAGLQAGGKGNFTAPDLPLRPVAQSVVPVRSSSHVQLEFRNDSQSTAIGRGDLSDELFIDFMGDEREKRMMIEVNQLLGRQNLAIIENQSRMKNGLQWLEADFRALLVREEMEFRTQWRRDLVDSHQKIAIKKQHDLSLQISASTSAAVVPWTSPSGKVGVSIRAMLGVIEAHYASIRHQLCAQEHARRTAITALYMLRPTSNPIVKKRSISKKRSSSASSLNSSSSSTSTSKSASRSSKISINPAAILQKVIMVLSMAETVERAAVASEWERTLEASRFALDHGLMLDFSVAETTDTSFSSPLSSSHTPIGPPPIKPTVTKMDPSLGEKYSCIIIQKWVRGWLARQRMKRIRSLWRCRSNACHLDDPNAPPTPLVVGMQYEDEWDDVGSCFLQPVSRQLYVDESSLTTTDTSTTY